MKFLALAIWALAICSAAAAAEVGQLAPDWHFTLLDGRTVSAADYKGRVVVIEFWATWCGPCKHEMPAFDALQRKYGGDGLVVLGVSIDAGPAVVRKYLAGHAITYAVGMSNDQIYTAFSYPDVVPTTYLIDRRNIIRDRRLGAASPAAYEKRILACLKAGPAQSGYSTSR